MLVFHSKRYVLLFACVCLVNFMLFSFYFYNNNNVTDNCMNARVYFGQFTFDSFNFPSFIPEYGLVTGTYELILNIFHQFIYDHFPVLHTYRMVLMRTLIFYYSLC